MKKLSLFLFGFLATAFTAMASEITPATFTTPANTGANMTVGINASKFDQFDGGKIGAFIELDGVLTCVGLETISTGFFGLAIWGDDSSTPEADGLASGAKPTFAILYDGIVILIDEIPQFTGYVTNGNVVINDGNLTVNVCSDASACNYTDTSNPDIAGIPTVDGACVIPIPNCQDCDTENVGALTLSDADGDGVCDADDAFENDPTETADLDGDGVGDNADAFPDDASETADSDGDGTGDNADAFPNDASETKDSDGDGLGDNADIYAGCTDDSACNYNSSETLNTDNSVCSYASDLDACATCSGETDGTGVVVDNDADNDTYCDSIDAFPSDPLEWLDSDGDTVGDNADACPDDATETTDSDGDGICDGKEIIGCTNPAATNYDPYATDNAVEGDVDQDGVSLVCVIEGVNLTPLSDSENTSIILTGTNMSLLFQPEDETKFDASSTIQAGDILAAVYETDRLENELLGYSAIAGLANAGSVIWTGSQVGLAVFGADNQIVNNGFDTYEDLKWLIQRNGVIHNATVTYLNPAYDGTYEDGLYVAVKSITIGAPANQGCTDATYMEYDPLATEDDGSCSTFISVGCNDEQYVNYAGAGVDVDAIHDNAENFGDAYGQNYTVDLNNGSKSPSAAPATIHDVDVCQTHLPGCTYPYASNYDSYATEDDGSCDWSSYALKTIDPVTGDVMSVDYNFGADNDDSNNDWNGSDFEYANDLYQGNAMGTGHVVTDLIAAYDFYTQQYKADSTAYAVNDSTWSADYDTLNNQWQRTYDDTLADVAEWFAEDERLDSIKLDSTINHWTTKYNDTLADVAEWFAEDERLDSIAYAELDSTWNALYLYTLDSAAKAFAEDERLDSIAYVELDSTHIALEGRITDSLNYHRAPIEIDLHTGWNTVGYYLQHSSSVIRQFEAQFGSELDVANNINIVKNNEGLFYWPDFAFDGLVTLEPGQGYQVRVKDESSGKSDFVFLHSINRDDYRVLTPTVPVWALEMQVENHPNDIRTLVRVVNMLGQEVNPAEQFNGEVLLYLYNDGTVEKKMTK